MNKKQLKKKQHFITIFLPILLATVACLTIFTTRQQNTNTFAFAYNNVTNSLSSENCPDSLIMLHARPIDLTREFCLERIYVIVKHEYSINPNIKKDTLINQAMALAKNLTEPKVSGWRCLEKVITHPRINQYKFNQLLIVYLEYASVQSIIEAVELWQSLSMVLTALPMYKYEKTYEENTYVGFNAFNASSNENLRWALDMIGIPKAQNITLGQGVNVGILHPSSVFNHNTFLYNNNSRLIGGNHTEPAGSAATNQAGIIGGSHENFGIAPKVNLFSLYTGNYFRDSINFAIDNNIHVISISWSWNSPNSTRQLYINKFNGVFVASAGNQNRDFNSQPRYPANYPGVIAVGAIDRYGERG